MKLAPEEFFEVSEDTVISCSNGELHLTPNDHGEILIQFIRLNKAPLIVHAAEDIQAFFDENQRLAQ